MKNKTLETVLIVVVILLALAYFRPLILTDATICYETRGYEWKGDIIIGIRGFCIVIYTDMRPTLYIWGEYTVIKGAR